MRLALCDSRSFFNALGMREEPKAQDERFR
jgi:hypothetical protein